jgi:ribose transport system substrate-binding protein
MGMLLALRQEGLAGKVRFVGFDASPPLVEALKSGEIDALVVQDPQTMGYRAVEAMLAHRAGRAVETVIDTGAVVVTRANISEPEIARLVQ